MAEKDKTLESDDLDLVDDALEDEGKDEATLWSEFDQAEGEAAASGDPNAEPSPDKGDDKDKGAEAAAKPVEGEPGDGDANRDQGAEGAEGDGGQGSDDGKKPSSDDATGKAQETDLWADATPEQRAAYDAAQKTWEDRDRRLRGQISALQRQVNDLSTRPAAPDGTAGKEQGKDSPGYLASEAWKGFEKEYPEVAAPLGTIIEDMHAVITRQQKELSAIGNERREDALDEQYDILIDAHPDWEQIADDPAFGTWLTDQPRHIREAAVRNSNAIVDAEETADVIGRFKTYRDSQNAQGKGDQGDGNGAPARKEDGQGKEPKQELSGRRQRQLDSASTARTRSSTGVTAGIPEDGDPEEIWKRFDEQEARQERA